MTIQSVRDALQAESERVSSIPHPHLNQPIVRKTLSWGEREDDDTAVCVSLTTDFENSGHTEAILSIEVDGSDCIEVLEHDSNRIVIKFMYGMEGGDILRGLKALFSMHE